MIVRPSPPRPMPYDSAHGSITSAYTTQTCGSPPAASGTHSLTAVSTAVQTWGYPGGVMNESWGSLILHHSGDEVSRGNVRPPSSLAYHSRIALTALSIPALYSARNGLSDGEA